MDLENDFDRKTQSKAHAPKTGMDHVTPTGYTSDECTDDDTDEYKHEPFNRLFEDCESKDDLKLQLRHERHKIKDEIQHQQQNIAQSRQSSENIAQSRQSLRQKYSQSLKASQMIVIGLCQQNKSVKDKKQQIYELQRQIHIEEQQIQKEQNNLITAQTLEAKNKEKVRQSQQSAVTEQKIHDKCVTMLKVLKIDLDRLFAQFIVANDIMDLKKQNAKNTCANSQQNNQDNKPATYNNQCNNSGANSQQNNGNNSGNNKPANYNQCNNNQDNKAANYNQTYNNNQCNNSGANSQQKNGNNSGNNNQCNNSANYNQCNNSGNHNQSNNKIYDNSMIYLYFLKLNLLLLSHR